jgi:TIR domain
MQGFISYAHDDHKQFVLLRRHLKAVERAFGIDFWADTRIKPGNYWNATIADAISRATVHILLFSTAFIESDYTFDHELPAIAAQKRARNDLVLPLVLKNCMWQGYVDVLQAFPDDGSGRVKPVCDWPKGEAGYHAANVQIADAIKAHFGIKPVNPINWGTP